MCKDIKVILDTHLTLSDAGVGRLNLGRGGRKMPPLPFEALVVLFDRKMVPNLISRRDQDVSTEKYPKSCVQHV